jgi:hypothetical protein
MYTFFFQIYSPIMPKETSQFLVIYYEKYFVFEGSLRLQLRLNSQMCLYLIPYILRITGYLQILYVKGDFRQVR